jgi:hypothetical protein
MTMLARYDAACRALAEAEARRDAIRVGREKTHELEQRRLRLNHLQADEPQNRSYEHQLAAARRAAPVLPLIRAASAAEENAARAKQEHDSLLHQYARFARSTRRRKAS